MKHNKWALINIIILILLVGGVIVAIHRICCVGHNIIYIIDKNIERIEELDDRIKILSNKININIYGKN